MKKFNLTKFVNQVVIIPNDKREWIKLMTALVLALLAKYGMELGEAETILLAGAVKAGADYVHFVMKEKGVIE
jgi:hypothetical protein